MRASKTYCRWLVPAVMPCAFLALGSRRVAAQSSAEIKKHIMRGVAVASRQVPAYVNALGAETNTWGDIYCMGNDNIPIKQSTIFRVETDSHYYDLSKVCGMSGDFRWPREALSFPVNKLDTWDRWEELHIGDHVALLRATNHVQLSAPRCQRLGYLSKSFNPFSIEMSSRAMRTYTSHCVYKVPIMHVRIGYSTTAAATGGALGTIQQTWDFRIVGGGPISAAKTTQIGVEYSDSLPPAW